MVNHKFWKCLKTLQPHLCVWYYSQLKTLDRQWKLQKRIFTKEKSDRQLQGQTTEIPPFLTVKEDNEQRHKMVVFNECNVIGAKFYKLTSMLGKLYSKVEVKAIQMKSISW